VNKTQYPQMTTLQAENSRLREELKLKDQLVEQLSQELLRLVKGNVNVQPTTYVYQGQAVPMGLLRNQLQDLEQQVIFYEEQIGAKDGKIEELERSVRELTENTQMLEQLLEELPHIYRQKFSQRLEAVKEKVEILQSENRKLQTELQNVRYLLAVTNNEPVSKLDTWPHVSTELPQDSRSIAEFGNV